MNELALACGLTESQVLRLTEIFTRKARRLGLGDIDEEDLRSAIGTVVMDTLMVADGDISFDEWVAADEAD